MFFFNFKLKASISRCAQPLAGFNARCVEDERLLDCIRETNPNSDILFVVDTRPKVRSLALIIFLVNL